MNQENGTYIGNGDYGDGPVACCTQSQLTEMYLLDKLEKYRRSSRESTRTARAKSQEAQQSTKQEISIYLHNKTSRGSSTSTFQKMTKIIGMHHLLITVTAFQIKGFWRE